jgi:hypothetical protein
MPQEFGESDIGAAIEFESHGLNWVFSLSERWKFWSDQDRVG